MKPALDEVSAAIGRHGLHKFASRMLSAEGLPAPKNWTTAEVAMTLGTKLAMDRISHQNVMAGLGSLHEITGSLGESREKIGLYEEFSRVNSRRELVKTASAEKDHLNAEVAFWQRCKRAAANDAEGQLIGLAKIAVSIALSADASGEKIAASADDVRQFAASFACAAVVDDAIVRMIKSAEVTPDEGLKLAALNAQAAMNDLKMLTKESALRTHRGGPGKGLLGDLSNLADKAKDGVQSFADKAKHNVKSYLVQSGVPSDIVYARERAASAAKDRAAMAARRAARGLPPRKEPTPPVNNEKVNLRDLFTATKATPKKPKT